jgi:hypothetical protein
MKQKESEETPVKLYEDVFSIEYILSNKQAARDKIISSNMSSINAYLNLLKTDVNKLLDSSADRESMLETFTDQLKYSYKNATTTITTLTSQ